MDKTIELLLDLINEGVKSNSREVMIKWWLKENKVKLVKEID